VNLLLVVKYSMKSFFVRKTVDVKLAARWQMQTIITYHLTGSLETELWDELNDLAHTIKRNDVTKWHAIGLEVLMNKEHLYGGGRSDNMEAVYHLVVQVQEVEEIEINEGRQGKVNRL